MQISPPFGYQAIVPFLRNQRVKLPPAGSLPPFARTMNAIPVSFTEFPVAHRDYPIVFSSGDEGKTFTPMAVLGLSGGENLFLDGEKWAAGAYVPAYARRFPFCMARVRMNDVEQSDRLICVEKSYLAEKEGEGDALFDANAQALPRWLEIEKLLQEYEADLERTREMCGILGDYGLLEPFSMQAQPKDGPVTQLTGMYRVEEKKLEFLNAGQYKNLVKKGVLGRIYTHLLSLDGFGRLLDRKAAPPVRAAA